MPSRYELLLKSILKRINRSGSFFWVVRCLGIVVFAIYLIVLLFNADQMIKDTSVVASSVREHLRALATVFTYSGLLVTLLAWLLNTAHDTECGIEIGVVYRSKYPHYFANIIFMAISAGICSFCSSDAPIDSKWILSIMIANFLGLFFEIIYVLSMTYDFLLRQTVRKMNTYRHLENCIKDAWSQSHQPKWDTIELECLINDLAYSSAWYFNCPAGWMLNRWTQRYVSQDGRRTSPQLRVKVRETYRLVNRIICTLPNVMQKNSTLGSFIFPYYLIDGTVSSSPGRATISFDLSDSFSLKSLWGSILSRFSMHDATDGNLPGICYCERNRMLICFISAWVTSEYDNVIKEKKLSESFEVVNNLAFHNCMDEIYNAIIHANQLYLKRKKDRNGAVSNTTLEDESDIININSFVFFVWSSALCFYFQNSGHHSLSNLFQYMKRYSDMLLRDNLIISPFISYCQREIYEWLKEVKCVVDIFWDRPNLPAATEVNEAIEHVYSLIKIYMEY